MTCLQISTTWATATAGYWNFHCQSPPPAILWWGQQPVTAKMQYGNMMQGRQGGTVGCHKTEPLCPVPKMFFFLSFISCILLLTIWIQKTVYAEHKATHFGCIFVFSTILHTPGMKTTHIGCFRVPCPSTYAKHEDTPILNVFFCLTPFICTEHKNTPKIGASLCLASVYILQRYIIILLVYIVFINI